MIGIGFESLFLTNSPVAHKAYEQKMAILVFGSSSVCQSFATI